MTSEFSVSAHWPGDFDEAGLQKWAVDLRARLGAPHVNLGLVFMAPRFFPRAKQILEILTQEPDLASLEILRRVREAGYEGGKTAVYALIARLRPKPAKPLVRFEGLPGEFSQHDFGEVGVQFLDGTRQTIHFFASRLKYSRVMRISLVPDEKVETRLQSFLGIITASIASKSLPDEISAQ